MLIILILIRLHQGISPIKAQIQIKLTQLQLKILLIAQLIAQLIIQLIMVLVKLQILIQITIIMGHIGVLSQLQTDLIGLQLLQIQL